MTGSRIAESWGGLNGLAYLFLMTSESHLKACGDFLVRLAEDHAFTDEIAARCRELELEANEKLQKEQLSLGAALDLPSWVPGIGNDKNQGDTAACKFEETGVLVREFASRDLVGNYEALQSMWDSLDKAQSILNGEESPPQKPGTKPAVLGDAEIGAVTTGLASWKNTTADTFRTKYVYSIGPRKANRLGP